MRMHVDQVLIVEPWTNAPLGTLLQMWPANQKQSCVGVRTEYTPGGTALPYLAVISGPSAGDMLDSQVLGNRPALNLTALLDIDVDVANAFSPSKPTASPWAYGEAYLLPPHGIAMAATIPNSQGIDGFVVLSGALAGPSGGYRGRFFRIGPGVGGPVRYVGNIALEPKPAP